MWENGYINVKHGMVVAFNGRNLSKDEPYHDYMNTASRQGWEIVGTFSDKDGGTVLLRRFIPAK